MPAAVASKEASYWLRLWARSQVRAAQIRERDFPWVVGSVLFLFFFFLGKVVLLVWGGELGRELGRKGGEWVSEVRRGEVTYGARWAFQDADLPVPFFENVVNCAHKIELDVVGGVGVVEVNGGVGGHFGWFGFCAGF